MHANPQRLPFEEPGQLPTLRPIPPGPKLEQPMLHFFRLLRLAFWRAFVHDAFATAKASAYSSILTFFPVLLIIGSGLANWRKGAPYLREVSYALGSILPAGGNTTLTYLKGAAQHPVSTLATTSVITLWTASGVMISWMDGFRRCYELPKTWGLVKAAVAELEHLPGLGGHLVRKRVFPQTQVLREDNRVRFVVGPGQGCEAASDSADRNRVV